MRSVSRWYKTSVVVTLLILMAASHAAGAERVWRPAILTKSDGTTVQGKVYITKNEMRIYNKAKKRYYDIPIESMQRLDTLIEREYMDKKWFFREDGRDEKVYTGEVYPIRRLTYRATFGDGKTISGKVLGRSVYLEKADGDRSRLTLKRKMEGEVGQTLEDLVYVKSIVFKDAATGVLGSIKGALRVPEGEKLRGARALNRKADLSMEGKVAQGRRYRFTQCMAGPHDLLFLTDKAIYTFFSAEKAEGSSRLHARVLEEIEEWKKDIRSLFEVEEPVYGAGKPDDCYVLVCMERTGKLTFGNQEKWAWVKMLRRYEIWHMRKPHDEWQIEKRHFVTRKLLGDKNTPRPEIVIDPRLGGHEVSSDRSDLMLNFALIHTDIDPIPPAPEGTSDNVR
jgi:hypothetical protein